MGYFENWFKEVWDFCLMWWHIGLIVCVIEGLQSFMVAGLLSIGIFAFAKACLITFVLGPLFVGSALFFIKGGLRK